LPYCLEKDSSLQPDTTAFSLLIFTTARVVIQSVDYVYLSYCISYPMFDARKCIEVAFCDIMRSILLKIIATPFLSSPFM
jgi:hypothetical protein